MKLICEYCENYVEETQEQCPSCGAVNPQYKRMSDEAPRTIYELKQWYMSHNLPPEEVTRFFIGKDIKEPKAFGIYEDGNRFIVYKNKSDGSRAVRYDGSDEAYAVNEIYIKLKEEITKQKVTNAPRRMNAPARSSSGSNSKYGRSTVELVREGRASNQKKKRKWPIFLLIFFLIAGIIAYFDEEGYYKYNGNSYYQYEHEWYLYDEDTSHWIQTEVDEELENNSRDYYESYSYQDDYTVSDFKNSAYYGDFGDTLDDITESWSDDDSTWDSDSSWDDDSSWDSSDSWDSGTTDWDTDW